MAAAKKTTGKAAAKAVAEKEVRTAAPAAEEKKTAEAVEVKPAEEKKPAARKAPAKKAELKSAVHVQFSGKSYSEEDLVKMAKDVWKYDLKQKPRSLESVELYVKPEENMVYYVMNQEFTGSFYI